jgi:hypothetical protein
MFNLETAIALVTEAPTVVAGVETLFAEVEKGVAEGKGDPIKTAEDILQELVANKTAIGQAVAANTK